MRGLKLVLLASVLLIVSGCEMFLGAGSSSQTLIVDLNAVAKATGRQEIIENEIEFANVQLTEQLKLVASKLEQAVADEKEKLGESPTAEEQEKLNNLVIQASQQLNDTKNLAIQQSNVFKNDLLIKFRQDVASIAQDIAEKAGSKMVVVSDNATLWFDPAADITDEVIAVMRANDLSNKSSNASEADEVETLQE